MTQRESRRPAVNAAPSVVVPETRMMAAMRTGTEASNATSKVRRRPSAPRRVTSTIGQFIAAPGRRRRFERLVGRAAASNRRDPHHGQRAAAARRECPEIGGTDRQQAVDQLDPEDRCGSASSAAARRRSSRRANVKVCGRSVISRRISRKSPEAASRPAYDHQHASARRSTSSRMWSENRIDAPGGGQPAQQVHHVQSLPRVHAVERLVEQQDRRFVDERGGDLDALTHALRVGADRRCWASSEVDGRDGPRGGGVRVGQPLQPGVEQRRTPAGQVGMDGLALRDEADVAIDRGIAPGRLAADQ